MQVTYYKLWQIKQAFPLGFKTAVEKVLDRNQWGVGNYPTDFRRISEKNAIRLLRTLGYPDWTIDECVKLVDERNDIAHPSGRVMYSALEATDERLSRGLSIVQNTQRRSRVAIAKIYSVFVRETVQDPEYDPVEIGPLVAEKLIRHNLLSLKDVEICQEHRLKDVLRGESLEKAEAIQAFLSENYG